MVLMLSVCLFGLLEATQGRFPALFQLGGDQPIIGINPIKLALSQGRFISQALQLLLVGLIDLPGGGLLGGDGLGIRIQFNRGERLEK